MAVQSFSGSRCVTSQNGFHYNFYTMTQCTNPIEHHTFASSLLMPIPANMVNVQLDQGATHYHGHGNLQYSDQATHLAKTTRTLVLSRPAVDGLETPFSRCTTPRYLTVDLDNLPKEVRFTNTPSFRFNSRKIVLDTGFFHWRGRSSGEVANGVLQVIGACMHPNAYAGRSRPPAAHPNAIDRPPGMGRRVEW